jgi:tetratricopeptide (TPR) repeat protein
MLSRKQELVAVETTMSFPSRFWFLRLLFSMFFLAPLTIAPLVSAEEQPPNWQAQVRKYCDLRDWASAMRVLEAQIARAPEDLDVKVWRARVLTWSGRLEEAENEYRGILAIDRNDPDNWAGLASVCLRQGKVEEALRAIQIAVQMDPGRDDLHAAYVRVLRAADELKTARPDFAKPPAPVKAGRSHKNELHVGVENDSLSYTVANQGQGASLTTRWTSLWSTNFGGSFYQRGGILADKFVGSVTLYAPTFAAITVGGAIANDHAVIPKSEAFFDFDRGLSKRDARIFKGVEFQYGQHWYWYQAARILTLNGATTLYLSRDWLLTLAATGARSAFSGTGAEWRPSGSTRLGFPLVTWSDARLSGNIFFAAGAENFANSDQIGRFSSQTYGGGLRCEFLSRMYATFTYSYQKRTQNRTDSYSGAGYGLRF